MLSSGMIAITAILLVEKSRLHSMVARIPDVGLKAGFRFAVMALVILPLLPVGPFGPLGGIRPRELWMMVLLFSGISFLAYIVRSFLGEGKGYVIAGLLGGLISSTNVTLSFSRASSAQAKARVPLALGVVAASTMLCFRVAAAAFFLNPAFGKALGSFPGRARNPGGGIYRVRASPLGIRSKRAGKNVQPLAVPLRSSNGGVVSSRAVPSYRGEATVGPNGAAVLGSRPGIHGCGRTGDLDGEGGRR